MTTISRNNEKRGHTNMTYVLSPAKLVSILDVKIPKSFIKRRFTLVHRVQLYSDLTQLGGLASSNSIIMPTSN